MSKTVRTSLDRIAELESMPLIYGSISSGAVPQYMVKKDYAALSALTEGGLAIDICLKKDTVRKRMLIEDNFIGPEAEFGILTETADSFLGILAVGFKSGSNEELQGLENPQDKVIVWINGVWSIIKKEKQGEDFMIPVELSMRIIKRTGMDITKIQSQLTMSKINENTFDSVSIQQLADVLNMRKDLYSEWEYDGVLNIMMNTDMRNGPYKLKREKDIIKIKVDVQFSYQSSMNGDYSIDGFDKEHYTLSMKDEQYKNAVIKAFCEWSGDYTEALKGSSIKTASFGYEKVKVSVEIVENEFPKRANVIIIRTKRKEGDTIHISNVKVNQWSIQTLGDMTIYNHYQKIDKNTGQATEKIIELDETEFYREVRHEFGHFMGLGDAYNGAAETDEVSSEDIMWIGHTVSSNDIEMLFLAALKNEKQYFYSNGNKIKSEAITM